MSKYAKAQEYRLKRKLESMDDVEVLEYYGSRSKNKGDFLVKMSSEIVRIDHKSFKKEEGRLQFKWLEKLAEICNKEVEEDGFTWSVITFGFYDKREIYTFSYLRYHGVKTSRAADRKGSWEITSAILENAFTKWSECVVVKMNDVDCYIYKLEKLVELMSR